MTSRIHTITAHCRDPRRVAEFWSAVLGYERVHDEADDVMLEAPEGRGPALLFLKDPEPKTVKNRLHLDLAPDDQDDEVQRLLDLGAARVDIGQGDVSWVVLADPEGNEFCVLTQRER